MARALFLSGLLLPGCLIGKADHTQRVEALDLVGPGESRPEITDVDVRFRFDGTLEFAGLSLVVQAVDEDGDLGGGSLTVDGETVPWGEGRPFVDDRYLFDLDVAVGDPCTGSGPTVNVVATDEAGNATADRAVELTWTGAPHGEPTTPEDALEPYFTITTAMLPVVLCGEKRSVGGSIDSYDDVELFAGGLAMETTANYPTPEGDLRHSYFFDPSAGTADQIADIPPENGGERLLFVAPPSEPMLLSVDSNLQSNNGDWRMFVQAQLGDPL